MIRIEIVWEDAAFKDGWRVPEEIIPWFHNPDHFVCSTIGYLFAQSDDYLIVVQGESDGRFLNTVCIPKSSVYYTRELKIGKETEYDETDGGDTRDGGQDEAIGEGEGTGEYSRVSFGDRFRNASERLGQGWRDFFESYNSPRSEDDSSHGSGRIDEGSGEG